MEVVQTGEASPETTQASALGHEGPRPLCSKRACNLVNLWSNWEGRVNGKVPFFQDEFRVSHRLLEDVQASTGWTAAETERLFHKVADTEIGRSYLSTYPPTEAPKHVSKCGFLEMLRLSGKPLTHWWAFFYKYMGIDQAPDPNLHVWRAVSYTINGGELNTRELYDFSHTMVKRRWAYTTTAGEYFYCKGLAEKAKVLMVNQNWHSKTNGDLVWPRQCPGSSPVIIDLTET